MLQGCHLNPVPNSADARFTMIFLIRSIADPTQVPREIQAIIHTITPLFHCYDVSIVKVPRIQVSEAHHLAENLLA